MIEAIAMTAALGLLLCAVWLWDQSRRLGRALDEAWASIAALSAEAAPLRARLMIAEERADRNAAACDIAHRS